MTAKRLLDVGLVLAAAPLLVLAGGVLALAVLVVDGHPVLFSQTRVGQGGRPFHILKLRSMTTEADPAARRPTRLGGWLRARGLDELPQVWNVLRGEMSLVGPRPLTFADAVRLVRRHTAFAARLEATPGITGLAQISGARGAELTAALDAEYARTRSVALDAVILLRTLWINVAGKRRGQRARAPVAP
jgi:lipopolysaccharide/colanic/teichoic acid biosynthesis glycosyltransferase